MVADTVGMVKNVKAKNMVTRPNCKLCTSPLRTEAELQFQTSRDRRAVQRWLADQGEDISYNAVKNHFARHVVISLEVPLANEASSTEFSLDSIAILEEMQRTTLQQVRKLTNVSTDERNIAPISSALFRGVQLVGQQVDLKARLQGYYNPADETTKLQYHEVLRLLHSTIASTTPEQQALLEPVTQKLELAIQHIEEG